MPGVDDAADLILRIVRSVVDTSGAVRVVHISEGGEVTYRVSVADEEMGQVIGKQGRTALARLASGCEEVWRVTTNRGESSRIWI
jgi:predicted RNA-binding protein YlqC (UPF0109 family)